MAQMPPPRPPEARKSNACIWLITSLFFLLIAAGGIFLVLYMTLPESEETVWFPAIGIILVGIPWLFWLMTCFYRTMKSRQAGSGGDLPPLRVATVAHASAGANTTTATAAAASASDSAVNSPSGARKVRFGTATTGGSQDAEADSTSPNGRPAYGEADGFNEASLTSHESERPLALSMS